MGINPYLRLIAAGQTLDLDQASEVMHLLLRGETSPEETAGLLLGLRSRGETIDELTAFTRVMREYAVPVAVADPRAIDIVGTGGDGSGTFNISTASMFVAAGAGATVAKHGNRSVSSKSGSADVLRSLGVFVELPAEAAGRCIADAGLGFMFAPLFHPAMRHVMPVRKALGVRSFFNILGPMCNPAGVKRGVFGAFEPDLAWTMGRIMRRLGGEHFFAVHAEDGLDEFSIAAPSRVDHYAPAGADGASSEGDDAATDTRTVRPEDVGLQTATLDAIKGGDADTNAAIIRGILDGRKGPARDVVVLNAAFALVAADIATDPRDGVVRAQDSIDSGHALGSLTRMIEASHAHRPAGAGTSGATASGAETSGAETSSAETSGATTSGA